VSDGMKCRAECPRHPGKTCQCCGIGDFGAFLRGKPSAAVIRDPNKTKHRHSHMEAAFVEGKGDGVANHYWGSDPRTGRKGHAYSFLRQGNSSDWMKLTEDEFDAALRNRRIRDRALRIYGILEEWSADPAVYRLGEALSGIRSEVDPPEAPPVEQSRVDGCTCFDEGDGADDCPVHPERPEPKPDVTGEEAASPEAHE
jgi:hypothetical protein